VRAKRLRECVAVARGERERRCDGRSEHVGGAVGIRRTRVRLAVRERVGVPLATRVIERVELWLGDVAREPRAERVG